MRLSSWSGHLRLLVLAGALAAATPAAAQCPIEDFDNRKLAKSLYKVEAQVVDGDLEGVKAQLGQIGQSIPCIQDVIDRAQLARFALAMATAAFYLQDHVNAHRWGMLARLLADPIPWPENIGSDHPLYEMVEGLEIPPRGRSPGGLVVPRGGAIFLNGELALTPEAYAEVPTLVQIFDGQAAHAGTYWQDGAAFPDAILSPGLGVAEAPRWLGKDGSIDRERAGRRVPVAPLAVGAGLAVVSAVSYAIAGSTAAGMGSLDTTEELTSARTTANALVLVSGVTAVGAVGVGVGGVLLGTDGRPLRGIAVSLRF